MGALSGSPAPYRGGMDSRRVRSVVGIALGVVLVVGFGLSRIVGGGGFGGDPAATCDDPVTWDQAGEVVGQVSAIIGPVAAATTAEEVGGAPTFLNLGTAHPAPERFDVVIYEDVRERFEVSPEALQGRDVCVRGEVRERDGVPQIVLRGPGWLSEQDGT